MKYILIALLLFFGCDNKESNSESKNLLVENKINRLVLPISSNNYQYGNVFSDTFKYNNFNKNDLLIRRLTRKIEGLNFKNGYLIIAEIKPNDPEHIGPIVCGYFLNTNGVIIDSLFFQETVAWEGSYIKTFQLDRNFIVNISEIEEGYDLESGSDSLIISKKYQKFLADTINLKFVKK